MLDLNCKFKTFNKLNFYTIGVFYKNKPYVRSRLNRSFDKSNTCQFIKIRKPSRTALKKSYHPIIILIFQSLHDFRYIRYRRPAIANFLIKINFRCLFLNNPLLQQFLGIGIKHQVRFREHRLWYIGHILGIAYRYQDCFGTIV